jgi:hypothetical protein
MEKEFIPYEQALALKELGFDEPCFSIYKTNGELIFTEFYECNRLQKYSEKSHIGSDWLSLKCYAPLYQQAFRWFREKYGLHIWISSKTNDKGETVYIPHGRTFPDTIKNNLIVDVIPYYIGKSNEEAELECLNKLIEIVK